MGVFTQFIVKSSIEIDTTPEKIWDFFKNIEQNYTKWHPKDHVFFNWVKGKPLEVGSKFDSKETVDGNKVRIKGTLLRWVQNLILKKQ